MPFIDINDVASQSDPSNYMSESSYADIISLGNRDYVNAWELALLDVTEIKEIGKVDSGTVIAEGTPVYSTPSYPDHDVVIVRTLA
ncbi:hypothetical protein PALU110988_19140 [Paenibacillus lupini]